MFPQDYMSVINSHSNGGSNFPSGFRQGNFTLPNSSTPGLPVGFVHAYLMEDFRLISQMPNGGVIFEQPVSSNSEFYLELSRIELSDFAREGSLIYKDGYSPYFDMVLPRGMHVLSSSPATTGYAIFSFIDRYGKRMTLKQNFNEIDPNDPAARIGKKLISIKIVLTTSNIEDLISLKFEDSFELPFTDYSTNNFAVELSASTLIGTSSNYYTTGESFSPMISSYTDTEPYLFDISGMYFQASWKTGTELTETTGSSRPIISLSEIVGKTPDHMTICLLQAVYGGGSPSPKSFNIPPLSSTYNSLPNVNEFYFTGVENYSKDWTGWKG